MNVVQVIRENRILQTSYSRLSKWVEIVPYYLYEEGVIPGKQIKYSDELSDYDVLMLESSDIKKIAHHPEVNESEEELNARLHAGCICIGAKDGEAVAAYTWCDLRKCSYENRLSFQLKEHEAYLFDARTFIRYRGKALAPYLRYQLYLRLNEMGRTKFYSTTSIYNSSAKRFKEKLNAQILKLYLFIGIYKKININITVKKYIH